MQAALACEGLSDHRVGEQCCQRSELPLDPDIVLSADKTRFVADLFSDYKVMRIHFRKFGKQVAGMNLTSHLLCN